MRSKKMSYNKEAIYKIVQDYFYLEEESFELFQQCLYNPEIDEVYKSFNLDKNHRRYWEIPEVMLEEVDLGWKKFKRVFHDFVDVYSVSYLDFRKSKVRIGKNLVKISKALLEHSLVSKASSCNQEGSFSAFFGYLNNIMDIFEDIGASEAEEDTLRTQLPLLSGFNEEFGFNAYKKEEELVQAYELIVKKIVKEELERIGVIKLPNKKLYLVLSLNFADWFFCASGESWTSCLNLTSEYGYWTGLPGLITDTNRAILYITDKKRKFPVSYINDKIEVDRMLSRSWTLLNNKSEIEIIKFYPSEFLSREAVSEITQSEYFKTRTNGEARKSRNSFPILYHKNGFSSAIFQDNTTPNFNFQDGMCSLVFEGGGVNFADKRYNRTYSASHLEGIRGGLLGLYERKESLEDYFLEINCNDECRGCGAEINRENTFYGGYGDPYCESCFSLFWTNCELCGDFIDIDNSRYVEGKGFLCNSCFPKHYFTCQLCSANCRDDQLYFSRYGEMICRECNFEITGGKEV